MPKVKLSPDINDSYPVKSANEPLSTRTIVSERDPRGWIIGVDLGSRSDRSVLVLDRWTIETETDLATLYAVNDETVVAKRRIVRNDIVQIKIPPLHTNYGDIVRQVRVWQEDLETQSNLPVRIAVDATGVGRGIVDQMKREGMKPIALTITSGQKFIAHSANEISVSKALLASGLQACLHWGRIRVAPEIDEADTFVKEMRSFKLKISDSGHQYFQAGSSGEKDDCVLAVSYCVFTSEYLKPPLTEDQKKKLQRFARGFMYR